MRKGFVVLLSLGFLLLVADAGQRWVYLHWLPELPSRVQVGASNPSERQSLEQTGDTIRGARSILVAGAGLDGAEHATGMRDLETARISLLENVQGPHLVRILFPGQQDYEPQTFLTFLADSNGSERLIVYLTGHGGGFNFGATSEFNLRTESILKALSEVECEEILCVVDCCWAGRFQVEAEALEFASPITIITSTDEEHPSPFPVSFLSPRSFGATFFGHLGLGEKEAHEQTNRRRAKLTFLYPKEMGLTGTRTRREPR